MKPLILFVDDDELVLSSLRRMLHAQGREWDMRFATGGPQALDILGTQAVALLVTDLRMAGMDGLELLRLAREVSPATARMVLSGFVDQDMLRKVVPLAHQFLSKPCEQEVLVSTIRQTLGFAELLADEALRAVVGRIDSLPSIPAVYARIVDELGAASPDMRRVAHGIESDPGLSASILKVVNSSFFGFCRKITSITQAVNLLGLDILGSILLTTHLFQGADCPGFSLARLLEHSLRTARLSRRVAEAEGLEAGLCDASLVAGLLHDVGKIVLAGKLPGDYDRVLGLVREEGRSVAEAEEAVFGVCHARVGAYLLGLWGMPGAVIEAIALHHVPCPAGAGFSPRTAVQAANILDHRLCVIHAHYARPESEQGFLDRPDLQDRVPVWEALVPDPTGREALDEPSAGADQPGH